MNQLPVDYWCSTVKMTFWARVDARGVVVDSAPIARKFIGQPFENLRGWLARQGGLRIERLDAAQGAVDGEGQRQDDDR